ncbi:MAG: hypothetical protein AAFQ06_07125, partial [Pseudomonadota bacterium]
TAEHLSRWAGAGDMDHLSLETRGRLKTLGPAKGGRARLWQDRSGAAAYLLWPDGARRLIRAATAAPGLAAQMIASARRSSSINARPTASRRPLPPPRKSTLWPSPHVAAWAFAPGALSRNCAWPDVSSG